MLSCCWVCRVWCKQKTAYERRMSDWSSDVCSSDVIMRRHVRRTFVRNFRATYCVVGRHRRHRAQARAGAVDTLDATRDQPRHLRHRAMARVIQHENFRHVAVRRTGRAILAVPPAGEFHAPERSEEHTSELQSLMRISYAVFCLKKKKKKEQS